MSFGVDNGSSAAVFCDPRTRQLLRARHLHLKSLYVEPHHSLIPVYVAPGSQYGNGLGLFAARRIPAGERIFREPPSLVMSQQLNSAIGMEFNDMVEKAMPLDPRIRAASDSLKNCWATTSGPGGHGGARLGRVRTNGMAVFLSTTTRRSLSRPFAAACSHLVSRVNHSCAPNVNFDWEFTTFQGSLVTYRQIEAEEEIFLSYVDVTA